MMRLARLPSACAALLALVACSDSSVPGPPAGAEPSTPASAEALARVRAIRSRFPGIVGEGAPGGLEQTARGSVRAVARWSDKTAAVELPAAADGAARLADDASGLAITFSLAGASPSPVTVADGVALYAGAIEGEGGASIDLLHRVHPGGTEDFFFFEREPERKALRYIVDVSAAAGLRLVERTLEFLDTRGAPRLRVAPPYLVDAVGAHVPASISVEGCAVDTSPRAPWGRPVTPPGAQACAVVVAWQPAGVRYPALLDPQWSSTTNTMIEARTRHTAVEINPGDPASQVLVAGGFNQVGNARPTAELYEPLSRTFAMTDAMEFARGAHTATVLTTIPPPQPSLPAPPAPPVLVAGGSDSAGGTPLGSLEVYNPATGLFVTDGNVLTVPRFNHTATLIDAVLPANRSVLLAGGVAPPLNQPTVTAFVYTFTAFAAGGGAPINSALASVGTMANPPGGRHSHTAVRLNTGNVLIAGGFLLSGAAVNFAELYNPATSSFTSITPISPSTATMTAQRGFHTATLLATGETLIIGGTPQTTGGVYTSTVDIYHDGVTNPLKRGFEFQSTVITMLNARANHTATLLPTGKVVVAGGFNGTSTLFSTEIYDPAAPAAQRFSDPNVSMLLAPRRDHTAVLVNAGGSLGAGRAVLVAGGTQPNGQPLATAQLLVKPSNGETCTIDAECESGHCSPENVCCNTPCTEQCYSCTAAGKQDGSPTGTCGTAKLGTLLPVICINEIEVHNQCDGQGHAIPHPDTRDCKPGTCGPNNVCITYCFADGDCSETGWCDLDSMPGSGGAGGGGGAGGAGGAGGGPPPGAHVCSDRLANGAVCDRDRQCLVQSHCVDGFCCDLPCEGSCQACDVVNFIGKCTAVGTDENREQPHEHADNTFVRPACPGTDMDGACRGYCGGNPDGSCKTPLPGGTAKDPECTCPDDQGCVVGPASLTSFVCTGQGGYTEEQERCGGDDGGFRCEDNGNACKTTCASDDDCIQDFICQNDDCVDLQTTGPSCDGQQTLRVVGDDEDCAPYRCLEGDSACLTTCKSVSDCVSPFVCNAAGQCVPQIEAPEVASCNCRLPGGAGGGDEAPASWILGALGALAVAAGRRRAERASRSRLP